MNAPLHGVAVRERRLPERVATVVFQERDDIPHAGRLRERSQLAWRERLRSEELNQIVGADVSAPRLDVIVAIVSEELLFIPVRIRRLLGLRRPSGYRPWPPVHEHPEFRVEEPFGNLMRRD